MKQFNLKRLICVSTVLVGLYSSSVFAGWDETVSGQLTTTENVGIGTSNINQSADMELYRDGQDTEFLIHEDAGTDEARLHLRRGTRDWEIINNGDLIFEGETEEKFRVTLDDGITIPKRLNLGADKSIRLYRLGDFVRLRSIGKKYTILSLETDPSIPLGDADLAKEVAFSLNRGVEGQGRELLTISNLDYGTTSHEMRVGVLKSGNGTLPPLVFRYVDQDTETIKEGMRFTAIGTTNLERVDTVFSGNVCIGATTPGSYKLAVEGKIGAREIVVTQAEWADHVFHDNYTLPSLNQVESYIKENKHLPDIPSAKEVEKDGLSMAEMMKKQMQKIEELTLYVIELKKENDAIKKELTKMQKNMN